MRRQIVRSLVYGTLVQIAACTVVFSLDGNGSSDWLLWNWAFLNLVSGPVVAHLPDGRTLIEPSVMPFIMKDVAGLILGITTYAALVYLALGLFPPRNGDLRRRKLA